MRLDVETIAGRRETMQEGVTQTMSLVSAAVCQPSARIQSRSCIFAGKMCSVLS